MGLPGCVFPGCVLPGCGFPGCVFPDCVLAPAVFQRANTILETPSSSKMSQEDNSDNSRGAFHTSKERKNYTTIGPMNNILPECVLNEKDMRDEKCNKNLVI